jgi:hypothetical protein
MKERVVAILSGRDSRCNKPGRGGQRKRREEAAAGSPLLLCQNVLYDQLGFN